MGLWLGLRVCGHLWFVVASLLAVRVGFSCDQLAVWFLGLVVGVLCD